MKSLPSTLAVLIAAALSLCLFADSALAQKGGARGAAVSRAPAARSGAAVGGGAIRVAGGIRTGGPVVGTLPTAFPRTGASGIRPIGGIAGAGINSGFGVNAGRRVTGGIVYGGYGGYGNYWTDPFFGFGWGYGLGGGYGGYGGGYYGDPYASMAPLYPPAGYPSAAYGRGGFPPSGGAFGGIQIPGAGPEYGPEPMATSSATVVVNVPTPTAELWFNGVKTQTSGLKREFVTPDLAAGKVFAYEVRARWAANGKEYDQTRILSVQAGSQAIINFMNDDREQLPQPSNGVLPPPIKM